MNIRNIAIIAHVDHGKTTLVDKILHTTHVFRANQETGDLIMDSNDLERERGITIFSKNAAVQYKGFKINVIDTPGHSDFGGEVERVLKMADGVLLLVDAFEGPMPQTRFVLQKALHLHLRPIVVINKVDKPNCRPDEVHDAVFELFYNLDATEEQLDFPTIYGSSKQGWMNTSLTETDSIFPLLDAILEHVPEPKVSEGTLQMQITSLDYSSFLGRIAVGKVARGSIKEGQTVALVQADGSIKKSKVKELYTFEGMGNRVILMGTSTGGTLALKLAATYPELHSVILLSPNIAIRDEKAWLLNNPWGLQIARAVVHADYLYSRDQRPIFKRFWYSKYRVEAATQLQELIETSMTTPVFKQVRQPVLLLYYYRDAVHQDSVVSVPAMLSMIKELGTPAALKRSVAIPLAGDHVIGSYVKSHDLETVQHEIASFMVDVLGMPPQSAADMR